MGCRKVSNDTVLPPTSPALRAPLPNLLLQIGAAQLRQVLLWCFHNVLNPMSLSATN